MEVGTPIRLDIGPALSALDKLIQGDQALRQEQLKTSALISQSFATLSTQRLVAYSDLQAAAKDELQASLAASKSAGDAVRELIAKKKELLAEQKKVNSTTADYQRFNNEIAKTTVEIQKAKQAQRESNEAVADAKVIIQGNAEAQRKVTNETKLAAAAAKDMQVQLRADAAVQRDADKAATAAIKERAAAEKAAATASKPQGGGGLFGGLGDAASAVGKVVGITSVIQVADKIISKIINTVIDLRNATAEYERVETTLTGVFDGNSAKADRSLSQIEALGNKLPFTVEQVEESYLKLNELGLKPTSTNLRQIADLAAYTGKQYSVVSDAIIAGSQGQLDSLRQLFITGKVTGDQITLSFKGVKTTIDNNQESISKYLLSLGDVAGVAGQAAAQLNTINGASAQAGNALSELYEVLGSRAKSAFSGFNETVASGAKALTEFFKTADRRAIDATAGAVENYETRVTKALERLATSVRARGGDVSRAIKAATSEQIAILTKEATAADKAAEPFNERTRANALRQIAKQGLEFGPGVTEGEQKAAYEAATVTQKQQDAILNKQKQLRGELDALKAVSEQVTKTYTDQTGRLGRIEELEKKITAEKALQAKINDGTQSADNPNGGGQDRRHIIAVQLKADEAELKRLREDEVKTRKTSDDALQARLRALYAERLTLTQLAEKAAVKAATTEGEQARLTYEASLTGIKKVRDALVQRELDVAAAARKRGGESLVRKQGKNADGVIDGAQEKALVQLAINEQDTYYRALARISAEQEQRLFDLRVASDSKQVDEVNRRYDKMLAAQHIGQAAEFEALDEAAGIALDKARQRSQEEIAIEEARQRDLLRLQFDQQARKDEQSSSAARNTVEITSLNSGIGTGVSGLDARRAANKAILEQDIKDGKALIQNSLLLNGEEATAAKAAANLKIAIARKALDDLEGEKKRHKPEDFLFKLLLGEQDDAEGKNRQKLAEDVSIIISSLNTVVQAQLESAQAQIDARNRNIDELQAQIQIEVQRNQDGSASNLKGLQDALAAERQARSEAIADKKKAQKEEQIINELQQVSSLATASANILVGFSTLPLIGQILGVAAIGAMLAAFIATKAAAGNAAKAEYFLGGVGTTGYTGDGNPRDESRTLGRKDYTYHKQEYILPHDVTQQFRRSLLEPLHKGRPQDIRWDSPEMRGLLPQGAIALLPDLGLADTVKQERQAAIVIRENASMEPLRLEVRELRTELAKVTGNTAHLESIKGSNQQMADQPRQILLADGRLHEIWPNGSTKTTTF